MLKLIGAAMIIVSTALWGFREADKSRCRIRGLEEVIFALKLLENEIVYGKRDIKNTLIQIGKNHGPEFLFRAAEDIETLGIKVALSQAMDKWECRLLGTDKSDLENLWFDLGMTDAATQVKTIRHISGILEKKKELAQEEYMKMGKLKKSMGLLVGIFAVIMLL